MRTRCTVTFLFLTFYFQGVFTAGPKHQIVFNTPASQIVGQTFTLSWNDSATHPQKSGFNVEARCPPENETPLDFCRVDSNGERHQTTCEGRISINGTCTLSIKSDNGWILRGWSGPFDVSPTGSTDGLPSQSASSISSSTVPTTSALANTSVTASFTVAQPSSAPTTGSTGGTVNEREPDLPLILAAIFGALFSISLLLILALVHLFVIRPRQRKRELLANHHDVAPVILAPLSHSTSTINHPHHHYTPPRYSLPLSSIFSKNRTSTEKALVDGKPGPAPAFNALTERQMNIYDQILQLKHLLISLDDAASPEFQAVMSRIQVLEGLVDSDWAVGRSDVVPDGLETR